MSSSSYFYNHTLWEENIDYKILVIYCLCDDFLKAIQHHENRQVKMTDAEVMTTAIVAVSFFSGNFQLARSLLKSSRYIPNMLSKSRFNRRLHRIKDTLFMVFQFLGQVYKDSNKDSEYIIDSFPVPVCDNYRIRRCKIYRDNKYRGYIASKKRYFYGLRIHLMVTAQGKPVELFLAHGSYPDVSSLKVFNFDLAEGSKIYADKAYTDYSIEDNLMEAGIKLCPIRKKNSQRAVPGYVSFLQSKIRKMVETAGSLIERMFPKSIHAVTSSGFELKVFLFVLAYSFHFIC